MRGRALTRRRQPSTSPGEDGFRRERLPQLLAIKYHTQMEGIEALGGTERARSTFIGFQRELYRAKAELRDLEG